MLDTLNHVKCYRDLAEECRRLARDTLSGQMKSRYLLMAKDYALLADVEEQSHYIEHLGGGAAAMSSYLPMPGRILQIDFLANDAGDRERTRSPQTHDVDYYPRVATSLAGVLTRCMVIFRSITRGLHVVQQIASNMRSKRFGSQ
jgi:hypothetical protein